MRLTITTLADDVYQLEVSDELEVENFKALCEVESGIPASEISLLHNGRPLYDDKKPLKHYGITDGDMVLLQQMRGNASAAPPRRAPAARGAGPMPFIDFGSIEVPGEAGPSTSSTTPSTSAQPPRIPPGANMSQSEQESLLNDPVKLREALLSRPEEVAILKERNPPLAEALLSEDLDKFTQVFREQQREREEKNAERIRMLNADPFDPDVQEKIAEEIRLKNVETNMETAMEFAPESFGQVIMLYIDCSVNGHPVKAFVDSGAQMTIMSVSCAERCNINRLVDRRWAGIAKGVGTQKIIGRVHLGQIQIGKDYLQSSFSILEDQPMDMLLGLDMLKRHQCAIDLKNNCLVIGTTGTVTPFLSESDLPSCARLTSGGGAVAEGQGPSGAEPLEDDEALAKALQKSAEEATNSDNHNESVPMEEERTQDRAPPPAAEAAGVNEADVSQLVGMGFNRDSAVTQLRLHRGDIQQAIAALIAQSLKF